MNYGTITIIGSGTGIETEEGNDRVYTAGDIYVPNGRAIWTYDGDDIVGIDNAVITGLMDGGDHDEGDTLIFRMDISPEDWANLDGLLATLPQAGSMMLNGHLYTWTDFENLEMIFTLAQIRDGRINPLDRAASSTGWCAGGGAQFYAIQADGDGEWAFNVTDAQVQQALADAFASGQHVLIGERLGVQLWALADLSAEGAQQLQIMGPDYMHIFPANTCGFTD